jgi:SAM-dependent methyltransferase
VTVSGAGRLPDPNLPRRVIGVGRRLQTWLIESRLGIDTVRLPPGPYRGEPRFDDACEYEAVHYGLFGRFIAPLAPAATDVVYDVGCGLGRTLCVFARRNVKECIGIELSPELAAVAAENGRRLRGRASEITVRVEDAATADYSRGTIYVFFNPFGEKTMQAALDRIRADVEASPRTVRVLYWNPMSEEVLESSGWLRLFARKKTLMSRLTASYWTNEGVAAAAPLPAVGPSPSRVEVD